MKRIVIALLAIPVLFGLLSGADVVVTKGTNYGTRRVIVGTTYTAIISSTTAPEKDWKDLIIMNDAGYDIFIATHTGVKTSADLTGTNSMVGWKIPVGESFSFDGKVNMASVYGKALTGNTTIYILYSFDDSDRRYGNE